MANQRHMEVLLTVLGGETDVTAITKQDFKQVMDVVENLPKRVVQPYRSIFIQQLIECDDVSPDELVSVEAIHKHLKIYKSLFKLISRIWMITDNGGYCIPFVIVFALRQWLVG